MSVQSLSLLLLIMHACWNYIVGLGLVDVVAFHLAITGTNEIQLY